MEKEMFERGCRRILPRAYFAEQVTGINETTVAGGTWAMEGGKLNLLARAMDKWQG